MSTKKYNRTTTNVDGEFIERISYEELEPRIPGIIEQTVKEGVRVIFTIVCIMLGIVLGFGFSYKLIEWMFFNDNKCEVQSYENDRIVDIFRITDS